MQTRRGLISAIVLGVVGPEVFIVQPGFVQGLVQYRGFDESTAGFVTSVEMFGIAATTIVLTFLADRFDWRRIITLSLLLMAAANVASIWLAGPAAFGAARFVAGLGAGGLVSLSFAAIGLTSNPDRNFGWLITWVLVYGAVALLLMPTAYQLTGLTGVLVFFAALPLAALLVVRDFPRGGEAQVVTEADAVELKVPAKGCALLAMFAYFLAQGVVWAYLFLIGLDGGLNEQQVANGLTVSQFAGVAGALLAATLGAKYGRARPLALGILGGALCLYFLVGPLSALVFTLVVVIYNFAWNLTHPYLLAAMASFDKAGRMVVYAVAMQMVGLAVGPFLAALVVGEGDYVNVLALGAALFVLSVALILPPVLIQARKSAGLPAI